MLRNILLTSTIASTLLLGACSMKPCHTETALDHQVRMEPRADSPEEIAQRAAETFAQAPGLTDEQRTKLRAVYARTYAEAMNIRSEIGQQKSLLFKLATNVSYKSKDIDKLKAKIVALDKSRLEVMFKALADVQAIVGFGEDKKHIYEHLRDYEMPRGGQLLGQEQ